MVQAILNGTKTQTRRVAKVKGCKPFLPEPGWTLEDIERWNKDYHPYGKPGDILWVREEHLIEFAQNGAVINVTYKDAFQNFYYKELSLDLNKKLRKRKTIGKWQRARFLPKELAIHFLKIKSIRVERLQEISEADAIAEGITEYGPFGEFKGSKRKEGGGTPYYAFQKASRAFQDLWESIHSEESWKANPFVWVIEFERTEKPIVPNVPQVTFNH